VEVEVEMDVEVEVEVEVEVGGGVWHGREGKGNIRGLVEGET